jgi:hypothetical protein
MEPADYDISLESSNGLELEPPVLPASFERLYFFLLLSVVLKGQETLVNF